MKNLLLIFCLLSAPVFAQYPGTTEPQSGDSLNLSASKVNRILYEAKSGTTPLTTTVSSSGTAAATNKGATSFATSQSSLTTSASSVSAARPTRRSVLIRNIDATISVYVGVSGVTSSTGLLLKAGESVTINTVAAVFAVAASGTPTVATLEEID